MSKIKSQIHNWAEQGHITQLQANELYQQETVLPDASSWRGFIASLLLWFGLLSFVCGVIFFFAYNWQFLGRFAKFGLIEVAIILVISAFIWCYCRANSSCLSTDHHKTNTFGATTANAALMAASLFVGGLLALVGQVYQTGADPWQLFALWALIILPFAWVAGFDLLWLLVVALFNLSLGLLFDSATHFGGILRYEQGQFLVFILLNLSIYYAFVFLGEKVAGRWRAPILEYACSVLAIGCFTWLLIWLIFEDFTQYSGFRAWTVCGYLGHLLLGFFFFRHRLLRIYPLALGGFSLIAVSVALLIKLMFEGNKDPVGGFLFIGLYIILASAYLSAWLKQLSRSSHAHSTALALNQGMEGENHERK